MADSSIRPAWLWIPWKKSPKNWRRKLAFFWKFLQILRNFAIFWRQFQTSHFGWKKWKIWRQNGHFSACQRCFATCNLCPFLSHFSRFWPIFGSNRIESDENGANDPYFWTNLEQKAQIWQFWAQNCTWPFQTKNRIFGSKFYIHSILNHWPKIGPKFGAENRHFSPKKAQNSEKPIPMPSKSRNLKTWPIHPSLGAKFWTTPAHGPAENRPKILAPKFHIFQAKRPQITENQQIKKHMQSLRLSPNAKFIKI